MKDKYNLPITIKVDNTPNPVYGAMGRKVTQTDTVEQQYRQALISDRTIIVSIDTSKLFHNEPIESVGKDLTPIRKMDDLR